MSASGGRLDAVSTPIALVVGAGAAVHAVTSPDLVADTGNGPAAVVAAVAVAALLTGRSSRAAPAVLAAVGGAALVVGTLGSSAVLSLLGALGSGVVLGALAVLASVRRLWVAAFGVASTVSLVLSITVVAIPRRYASYVDTDTTTSRTIALVAAMVVTVLAIALRSRTQHSSRSSSTLSPSARTALTAVIIALVGLVPVLVTNLTAAAGAAGLGAVTTTATWSVSTIVVTVILVGVALALPSGGILVVAGTVLWLSTRPASVVVLTTAGTTALPLVLVVGVALACAVGAAAGARARPAVGPPLAILCCAAVVTAIHLGTSFTGVAVIAAALATGAVVGAGAASVDVPAPPAVVGAGLLVPLALTTMPSSPISADFGWTAYTPLTLQSGSVTLTEPTAGTLVTVTCLALCAVGAELIRRRRG
ncbi:MULTISPECIES: hypothetical protein [Nocardiaceae]|uniref:Uncharacterized protein n=1 Tax=Rhodococcoides corynebacterioides TaxID=53972 RepID=A0ABS2KYH8_9NOCA|nr:MULTISPECIES: hypothetical protein [Rhodococcus]MBM7416356.1 hypothetical protein [Rhodococcus corynebacterioides]MBP1114609.1 hypothetical protein [Rhodococcus sp. PvP016]